MKFMVDTDEITDIEELGEFLRKQTFVGDGMGCYSTFELREYKIGDSISTFKEKKPTKKILDAMGFVGKPEGRVYCYDWEGFVVAWYWDGDGTLLFAFDGRMIVNTDCKKTYGWKEIKKGKDR